MTDSLKLAGVVAIYAALGIAIGAFLGTLFLAAGNIIGLVLP